MTGKKLVIGVSAGLEIYYDGDCPFCSAYMKMLNLRAAVGRVELIDARSGDPRLRDITAAGFDLDEGIVLRHGTRLIHGAEAMQLLSVLSEGRGFMRWLMRAPRRAAFVYPFMRMGRRLTLWLMGRKGLS